VENFRFFSGQLIHAFYHHEGGISQWERLVRAILGAYVWARRAISLLEGHRRGAAGGHDRTRDWPYCDVINGEHHGTRPRFRGVSQYVNPDTLG